MQGPGRSQPPLLLSLSSSNSYSDVGTLPLSDFLHRNTAKMWLPFGNLQFSVTV